MSTSPDSTGNAYVHDPACPCRRDRSAGRWCQTCNEHGSHHSDRHEAFHLHARSPRPAAPSPVDNDRNRRGLLRRVLRRVLRR